MIGLTERQYDLHVALGAPDVLPWNWNIWLRIAAELEPTLSCVDGRPATYSRQLKRVGKRLEKVSFRRMGWGAKVHERWSHESPHTKDISDEWVFCDTEVWVPGRTTCEREHRRPDVYFQVLNGGLGSETPDLKFASILTLGVAADLSEEIRSSASRSAVSIGQIVEAKLRIFKRRSWSLPLGSFAKGSINNIDTWLFRAGDWHDEEPSLALLRENWQLASG